MKFLRVNLPNIIARISRTNTTIVCQSMTMQSGRSCFNQRQISMMTSVSTFYTRQLRKKEEEILVWSDNLCIYSHQSGKGYRNQLLFIARSKGNLSPAIRWSTISTYLKNSPLAPRPMWLFSSPPSFSPHPSQSQGSTPFSQGHDPWRWILYLNLATLQAYIQPCE